MATMNIYLVDDDGNYITDSEGNKIILQSIEVNADLASLLGTSSAADRAAFERARSIPIKAYNRPYALMSWRIKQIGDTYIPIINEHIMGGHWSSPWAALGQCVGTSTRYNAVDLTESTEIEEGTNVLSIAFQEGAFTVTGRVVNVNIADYGWAASPRLELQSRPTGGSWAQIRSTITPLENGAEISATTPAEYDTEYRACVKEDGGGNNAVYSTILPIGAAPQYTFVPDKRPMAASLTKISTSANNYDKRGWGKSQWAGATSLSGRTGLYDMCDNACVPMYDEGVRRFWFWNPAGFANVSSKGNYPDYKWYTSNSWTAMADGAQPSDFNANLDGSVKMPQYSALNAGRQQAWSDALNDFAATRPDAELGIYGGYDVPYLNGELDYDTITFDGSGSYKSRYENPDPTNPEHVEYWQTQANGWTDNTPVTAMGFDTGSSVYDDGNQEFFNTLGVKPLFEAVPLIFISSNNYETYDDDRYAKAAYWAIYNGQDQPSATGNNKGYWEGRTWRSHDWLAYEATYGGTEMHFAIAYYTARFNNKASASDMQQAAADAHALGYVVGITGSSAVANSVSAQQYVDLGYGTLEEGQALTGSQRGAIYDQEVKDFCAFLVNQAS